MACELCSLGPCEPDEKLCEGTTQEGLADELSQLAVDGGDNLDTTHPITDRFKSPGVIFEEPEE